MSELQEARARLVRAERRAQGRLRYIEKHYGTLADLHCTIIKDGDLTREGRQARSAWDGYVAAVREVDLARAELALIKEPSEEGA